MRALIAAGVAALAVVGCTLDVNPGVGKSCQTAFDCPDGLSCVNTTGSAQCSVSAAPCTCEALAAPVVGTFEEDAGVAYYCDGAKPVLDSWCISCHTIPPLGGAPATFRLDTYESDGGVPGAKDQAERVYIRSVVTKDMPPGLTLPEEDQRILTAWFKSGAQFCDAGTTEDAGP